MKQQRFGFKTPVRREKSVKAQTNDFDSRNLAAAKEILRNVNEHGGPEAFPAVWSHMVLERLGEKP